MIDHIGFPVSDYARSKAFYEKALAPLGYTLIMEVAADHTDSGSPAAGFGKQGKPDFWIGGEGGLDGTLHIAIASDDRGTVDAFYRAAIAAGGRDNGAPGLRPQYHPNYYGAFVLDPDGHNVEAVCHAPARRSDGTAAPEPRRRPEVSLTCAAKTTRASIASGTSSRRSALPC
jgi:catechol 2,3-dioxygenase-like lactoylglutathione lyase family enzyme